MVHVRTIDGRTLDFGHSGWLWRSSYLLYDRETGSVWHHATGIALAGPMRGKRLARIATTSLMTYAAWCRENPGTLVLAKPLEPDVPVDSDAYAERNRRLEFGLALDLPGAALFYPHAALPALGAVEDEAAGIPFVVVRDAATGLTLAFDRRVDGSAISFDVAGDAAQPVLRERGGRRAWALRTGAALAGTGAAAALRPLPGTPFESMAWTLQNPRGSIRRP